MTMHRALRVCALLVGGAIVNTLVSWACAAWSPLRPTYVAVALVSWSEIPTWVEFAEERGFGLARLRLNGYYVQRQAPEAANVRELPRWSRLGEQSAATAANGRQRLVTREDEITAGWPCGALMGFRTNLHIDSMKAGWHHGPGERIIPLWPVWPGFAINTVFHAILLRLMIAAPIWLRTRRRIKRGLCPSCAYDLRGAAIGAPSDICPECGAVAKSGV